MISDGYRGFEWGENYFGLFGAWLNSVAGLAYPGAANAAADGYLYSTLGTAFVFNRTNLPSQRFSARFFFQPIEHCHFRPGSIVLYAMYGNRGMDVNITVRYSASCIGLETNTSTLLYRVSLEASATPMIVCKGILPWDRDAHACYPKPSEHEDPCGSQVRVRPFEVIVTMMVVVVVTWV